MENANLEKILSIEGGLAPQELAEEDLQELAGGVFEDLEGCAVF